MEIFYAIWKNALILHITWGTKRQGRPLPHPQAVKEDFLEEEVNDLLEVI